MDPLGTRLQSATAMNPLRARVRITALPQPPSPQFLIASATGPWAYSNTDGFETWLGLLSFTTCVGGVNGTCFTVQLKDYQGYTGDGDKLRAAAAWLFIGFIVSLMLTLVLSVMSCGAKLGRAAFPMLLALSASAFVASFIGCVIAGNEVRSLETAK